MNYQVRLSRQAKVELGNIFEYICYDLQSPESAQNLVHRLEEGIFSLSYLPHRFREIEKIPWHSEGIRQMPIGRYLVFYSISEAEKTVFVLHIVSERMNVQKYFGKFVFA